MITWKYNILILLLVVTLGGCASRPPTLQVIDAPQQEGKTAALKTLYSQLKEWQGVNYRMGGLSKKGIDCSGFVLRTYKDRFGINLPRTTEKQAKSGQPISLQAAQTGDLVFFNTGFRVKHVGIYLENGTFLHASTSRGVMVSKLSNPYWTSNYWKAVRIPQFAK